MSTGSAVRTRCLQANSKTLPRRQRTDSEFRARAGGPLSFRCSDSVDRTPLTFPLVMVRARLSVADILHRGVVLSLVGVCVWGIGTGILVHRDTLRMGRG